MVSGRALAEAFWQSAVAPVLSGTFPGLRYAAGRLGSGSDVLGVADARSRDHDWGCRLTLLVDDPAVTSAVSAALAEQLPESFDGHPVRFPTTWDSSVAHRVEV